MSDHDDRPDAPQDAAPQDAAPPAEAEARPLGERPDPRLRPPDPAGTQPKFDPAELLPPRRGRRIRADHAAGVVEGDAIDVGDPASYEDRDLLPQRRDDAAAPAPAAAAASGRESRYAPRFQFMLGALLAVGAAAIVFAAALIAHDRSAKPATAVLNGPSWSNWHPWSNGVDAPTQIAEHVGKEYRLPDRKQLVAVTGGPLEIAGLPVTVAVRQTPAQGGDIKLVNGTGVLYRMCGLGPKCSIASGKASRKRHLLLRREALELALYSFRYLSSVDEAVVFLPPRKGKDPTQALFFRRQDADLQNAVARPLDATLVSDTPSVAGVTRSPDAQLVNTITTSKLFTFSFTQANQDARAFLVLDPLPN